MTGDFSLLINNYVVHGKIFLSCISFQSITKDFDNLQCTIELKKKIKIVP